jgi:hypothetical protein
LLAASAIPLSVNMHNQFLCQSCNHVFEGYKSTYICDVCEGNIDSLFRAASIDNSVEEMLGENDEDCPCAHCRCEAEAAEQEVKISTKGMTKEAIDKAFEDFFADPMTGKLIDELFGPKPQQTISGKPISKSKALEGLGDPSSWATEEEALMAEFQRKPKSVKKDTLVINLFSGPGSRKSTIAGSLFAKLKWRGIIADVAWELPKELIYEENFSMFPHQIYIFGEMYRRHVRALGKVDVLITDCPLLLSAIYGQDNTLLRALAITEHTKLRTYNVFLKRNSKEKYDEAHRNQTEAEAKGLDREIASLLNEINAPFETFDVYEGVEDEIIKKVMRLIRK